jgi:hypothetical protein
MQISRLNFSVHRSACFEGHSTSTALLAKRLATSADQANARGQREARLHLVLDGEVAARDPSAKLWIHQGRWLRANARKDRNLYVKRWHAAQTSRSKKRNKKARWSALTPLRETVLELKGALFPVRVLRSVP